LGRNISKGRLVERASTYVEPQPLKNIGLDNISMNSKYSTVSRGEDIKLNWVQRLSALFIGLLVIFVLGYLKFTFFKPPPKYCPHTLSKSEHDLFNSLPSCNDDSIINTVHYDSCLKFKGCILCPGHGYCADNGTLVGCEPTFEI
jgi:hypothetical protein